MPDRNEKKSPRNTLKFDYLHNFFVVGIGASAEGLRALEKFFKQRISILLPDESINTYFVNLKN